MSNNRGDKKKLIMSRNQILFVLVVVLVSGCSGTLLQRTERKKFGGEFINITAPNEVNITVKEDFSIFTPIATVNSSAGLCLLSKPSLFFKIRSPYHANPVVFYLYPTSFLLDSNYRYLWNEKASYINVSITCMVKNSREEIISSIKSIRVNVVDVKENHDIGPVFERDMYEANVTENVFLGTPIQQVSATYPTRPDARIQYRLENDYNSFIMDSTTGEIDLNRWIYHKEKSVYNLRVLAIDRGHPQLTGSASVRVYVLEASDKRPKFTKEKFLFEIPRNASMYTEVGKLTTDHYDRGEFYFFTDYHHESEIPFRVVDEGVIIVVFGLDSMESKCLYEFIVMVQDNRVRPKHSYRNYVKVVVKILDCLSSEDDDE